MMFWVVEHLNAVEYATMVELTSGLAKYFVFYNGERPHQSLGDKTPEVVYWTALGGAAMILDKYPPQKQRQKQQQHQEQIQK